MKRFFLPLLFVMVANAVIIDRIAIEVGSAIIKDSDIQQDLRVTDFLNGTRLDLSQANKKKAADRLVDQAFIRREIHLGDYPTATPQDAEKQLKALKKQRFPTAAAYERALSQYGLTDAEVKNHFQWQLTVLQFIDARFKPAAYVSDQEIDDYYKTHAAQLHREYPGKSGVDELREDIRKILTGEKVNKIFFDWLDNQRKQAKIQYLEQGLA